MFSELGADTTLRSRPPGVNKKIPAVAIAVCLTAPLMLQGGELGRREKQKAVQATALLL